MTITEPKSDGQIQTPDQTKPILKYLDQNQALVLTALLINPNDILARASLGWSKQKFYKYKKEVQPLKEEFATQAYQDTMFALSLAGKHAVSTYIDLMDQKHEGATRKETADTVLDRMGVIRKSQEQQVVPIVQNIIANKMDKYVSED